MTSLGTRPWLPKEAVDDAAIASCLDEIVARWRREWVAADAPAQVACTSAATVSCLFDGVPQVEILEGQDAAVVVLGEADVWRRLFFGINRADVKLARADRSLLRRARLTAICGLFESIFRAAPSGHRKTADAARLLLERRRVFSVAIGEMNPALLVALDDARATNLRLDALPERSFARGSLASRREALSAVEVAVGVELGECGLRFGELRQLSRGDVLVLDRTTAERLPLRINGEPTALTARLERQAAGGPLILKELVGDLT